MNHRRYSWYPNEQRTSVSSQFTHNLAEARIYVCQGRLLREQGTCKFLGLVFHVLPCLMASWRYPYFSPIVCLAFLKFPAFPEPFPPPSSRSLLITALQPTSFIPPAYPAFHSFNPFNCICACAPGTHLSTPRGPIPPPVAPRQGAYAHSAQTSTTPANVSGMFIPEMSQGKPDGSSHIQPGHSNHHFTNERDAPFVDGGAGHQTMDDGGPADRPGSSQRGQNRTAYTPLTPRSGKGIPPTPLTPRSGNGIPPLRGRALSNRCESVP